MTKKYKTGLVLGGGGVRGFAHIGVLAALFEKELKPDIISGVSTGAIIGALIAGGKKPEEIFQIFKKGGLFRYSKMHFPIDGLLRLDGLKEVLENEIPYKTIEELPMPLCITVSNINKGIVEYKREGQLSKTVLASSSIPILFSPVKLNNDLYVDGGLLDNVPVTPIEDNCERIIVSNISPINPKENIKNLVQIAARTFYMSVNPNSQEIKNKSWLYIEPEGIEKYDIIGRSHAEELYELGYKTTISQLKEYSSII